MYWEGGKRRIQIYVRLLTFLSYGTPLPPLCLQRDIITDSTTVKELTATQNLTTKLSLLFLETMTLRCYWVQRRIQESPPSLKMLKN
jgi:hypothetical protein